MKGAKTNPHNPRWIKPESQVARGCDHLECGASGHYRAPRAPDQLDRFYWFCLDHVREYNRAWDYYSGMSEPEIEAQIRADTVWQRTTSPLGAASWQHAHEDVFEGAKRQREGDGRYKDERHNGADPFPTTPNPAEDLALAALDLAAPVTEAAIKARYKKLVKRFHPDANGGDKVWEEKLKQINEAYATLMNGLAH